MGESKNVEPVKSAPKNVAVSNANPPFPASKTGGVIPMSIESRFRNERARLSDDFSDKWRKWRVQFLKDQELHPTEPRHVLQLQKEITNPIRRLYQKPLNWLETEFLPKYMSKTKAEVTRLAVSRVFMGYLGVLFVFYQLKYNPSTWEKRGGFGSYYAKPTVLPGDHRYPLKAFKTEKQQFADKGFSQRKALRFDYN